MTLPLRPDGLTRGEQSAERLVGQQELGRHRDGAGGHDARLLAAGAGRSGGGRGAEILIDAPSDGVAVERVSAAVSGQPREGGSTRP